MLGIDPGIQSHYVGKCSTVVAHGWNIDQLAVRRASVVSTTLRGVESDRVRCAASARCWVLRE